jgi:hypothetical protein
MGLLMVITETIFNFREVNKENARVQRSFRVLNEKAHQLAIKSAEPGRRCAAARFDRVVAPRAGGEGEVLLALISSCAEQGN